MDNLLLIQYFHWGTIIGLTLLLFSLISKAVNGTLQLFIFVVIPVWLATSIIQGLSYIYLNQFNYFTSLGGFIALLAENLPSILIFGCTTFYFKLKKFKKLERINKVKND